jgi:predicted 2-oxoglutarate/Fe(II)-dependent dioxygenase YbiX
MEVKNNNSILDYIRIFDDALDKRLLKKIYRYAKDKPYFCKIKPTTIDEGHGIEKVEKDVRSGSLESLRVYNSSSMTNVRICNFLTNVFKKYGFKYLNLTVGNPMSMFKINQIDLLRYGEKDHFIKHIDAGSSNHRNLSFILMLNDDYEGGQLEILSPRGENINLKIPGKANRLIMFPSNFMYPHIVHPITKGERFTVVAWAQ